MHLEASEHQTDTIHTLLEEILSFQHTQLSQQQDLLGIVTELKEQFSSLSTSTPSQDMKHLKTLLNQLHFLYVPQPASAYPISMTSTLMFGLS